jgi:hypothetical protein
MADDQSMGRDDESSWGRQLLVGFGVLVGVSLLVGAVVGALALGAADVVGLGPSSNSASYRPSLWMPSGVPTTRPEVYPPAKRLGTSSSAPQLQPVPSDTATPTPTKPPKQLALQGYPNRVSPGQRIDLTGVYEGAEGAVLQVQRFEGGAWTDFPVTTTVSGGVFSTYVTTSRPGLTRFRVVDTGNGKHSNAVRITVG